MFIFGDNMKKEVKITFRGWAGHFICGSNCLFRLNTLLEYKDKKVVVSTVGLNVDRLAQNKTGKQRFTQIGIDRHFETMAFHAQYDGKFWDMDVKKQIYFDSPWAYSSIEDELKANDGHYKVVEEIKQKLLKGEL